MNEREKFFDSLKRKLLAMLIWIVAIVVFAFIIILFQKA